MHRTFVRTIRAGGSVEIETPVTFPARYGIVTVVVLPEHDGSVLTRLQPGSDSNNAAFAVINERAAPAGYVQRICLDVGKIPESCTR
jgi:hypothetical protein